MFHGLVTDPETQSGTSGIDGRHRLVKPLTSLFRESETSFQPADDSPSINRAAELWICFRNVAARQPVSGFLQNLMQRN